MFVTVKVEPKEFGCGKIYNSLKMEMTAMTEWNLKISEKAWNRARENQQAQIGAKEHFFRAKSIKITVIFPRNKFQRFLRCRNVSKIWK